MTIWPDVVSYDFRFTPLQVSSNVSLLPGRDEVTTYVLSYGNSVADNPQVISYPTRPAAVTAAGRQPNGLAVFSIEKPEDVPFGNGGMRDLFNALIEKNRSETFTAVDLPKKVFAFHNRADAIRQLLALFSKVAVSAPTEAGTPEVPPLAESTSRGVNMARQRKLGEFSPLRAGTILHKVLEAALTGHLTVQQIAERVNKEPKTVLALLSQGLGVQHGIGYQTDDAEHVHIVIPDGKTAADLTKHVEEKQPREAKARKPREANGAGPHGIYRMSDMVAAAARGEMPEKPVIRSEANKGMQRHFDKLAEFANSDNWEEVRKYPANGSNNYAKMVRQYRDSLVRAHAVQTGEVPSESEAVAAE